ncbi:MAG TPA: hypothetical protein VFR94_13790 [Nitrososphaeraceae archaeon]|nr:hypothetical protein [Nitrososphaeraceae archaeon]
MDIIHFALRSTVFRACGGIIKTATNILVAVVAGLVDTINIWNAATLTHFISICIFECAALFLI